MNFIDSLILAFAVYLLKPDVCRVLEIWSRTWHKEPLTLWYLQNRGNKAVLSDMFDIDYLAKMMVKRYTGKVPDAMRVWQQNRVVSGWRWKESGKTFWAPMSELSWEDCAGGPGECGHLRPSIGGVQPGANTLLWRQLLEQRKRKKTEHHRLHLAIWTTIWIFHLLKKMH